MTVAFTNHDDLIIPNIAGETYRGQAGDDTYILSNALQAGQSITIVDTEGANVIQLFDGLSIASSMVLANGTLLTLSNGASVEIQGSASFTYDVGGNAIGGTTGVLQDYATFVKDTLGTAIPAASDPPSEGGAVIIVPIIETDVSADIGSLEIPGALNADSNSFKFTEDADVFNNVEISNFTSNDIIEVSNASAGDYSFSNDGADVDIIYNNDGTINRITLLGVVSASDIVGGDEASFETAIGFDAITFA